MDSLKKKLLKNLEQTYCRLGPSKYGVGVFAIKNIPKNINPYPNCRKVRWLKFSKKEIANLSPEIRQMINEFYGSDEGYHYIPVHGLNGNDVSFYHNHSENCNLATKDGGQTFVTSRAIKKGEELLADYRTYDPEDKILKI